jgi:DNA-binding PadR family transcriptional regulator
MAGTTTEIDALRIALLAVCSPEHAVVYRIHGELEHWLNRQLATAELEAALAELEGSGLLAARREAAASAWLTTDSGRALVAARWEEFFPE